VTCQVFSAAMYGGRNDDLSKAFASGRSARNKVDSIMTEAAAEPQESMEAMTKEQIAGQSWGLDAKVHARIW
jgi:hypothetical protein